MRARRCAVDFVGHQQLAEHRPLDEPERAAAVFAFFENFGPDDVARHQVGRELDAFRVHAEHGSERIHKAGLGQTRHADQQPVAAGQERDQNLIHDRFLAEDETGDGFARLYKTIAQFLCERLGFSGIQSWIETHDLCGIFCHCRTVPSCSSRPCPSLSGTRSRPTIECGSREPGFRPCQTAMLHPWGAHATA